jgi:phosphotransferase system IIB component
MPPTISRSVTPILSRVSYCATRLSLLVTDMISSRESEREKEGL